MQNRSLDFICPHCKRPSKKNFCPHCGSNAQTGFAEGASFSDLELPDYEEILENEQVKKTNPFLLVFTILLVLAFVLLRYVLS